MVPFLNGVPRNGPKGSGERTLHYQDLTWKPVEGDGRTRCGQSPSRSLGWDTRNRTVCFVNERQRVDKSFVHEQGVFRVGSVWQVQYRRRIYRRGEEKVYLLSGVLFSNE